MPFQVVEILSRVLQDLVIGEVMQLQTTHNLEDRLSHSSKHLEGRFHMISPNMAAVHLVNCPTR